MIHYIMLYFIIGFFTALFDLVYFGEVEKEMVPKNELFLFRTVVFLIEMITWPIYWFVEIKKFLL